MLDKIKIWCQKNFVRIIEQKNIQYGTQLKLEKQNEKISVGVYNTGKFLVQGKDSQLKQELQSFLGLSPGKSAASKTEKTQQSIEHNHEVWIGVDESGKGDFFGPLVVSAVVVHKKLEEQLKSLGVVDSKKLSDQRIMEMAPQLMGKLKHHSEALMPIEYNQRYSKVQNLNILLGNLHVDCIEQLFDDRVDMYLSDQFSNDKSLLENIVKKRGLDEKKLMQAPKAEQDLAVACASIIARYHFIELLNDLSSKFGMVFPKGAGDLVNQTALDFRDQFGIEKVKEVAKVHFKTFERLL
ncbi:MAG: ribonuclease HIII [Bdellovibrionaceae bacterium]|nr:ribonuclease HIII [Pseudobdellovibrionaceae bacterium]|tara:strand:- start:19743 stop:20630 length:888 start_codon:yes stop_codon:yes gene_type:complete